MKNAIRKFRGEFEEYIRRTNPTGYMETAAVEGAAGTGAPLNYAHAPKRYSLNTLSPTEVDRMPTVIVDGIEVANRKRGAAQRHPGRRAGGDRHSPLLLASGLDASWPVAGCAWSKPARAIPKPAQITMVPKLVPACQTPATDNTVFVTNSDKVLQSRAMVEEDLLIDHPIDCPICDKAGECSVAGLSFRAWPEAAPGRHPPLHQPPPRHGQHRHAVRRSLRDVQPLRALHPRDQRHRAN